LSGIAGLYSKPVRRAARRARDAFAGLREGWLKLRVDRTFPLAQAAEAHRLLEGRQTVGKLSLTTAN
jgi:NADPH:quinone reductase